MCLAIDMDNGNISIYKNGTWFASDKHMEQMD